MKITCLIDILSFTSLSNVWFYHFCFTDMESFFKQIVDTFTKSDELEEFAILWSIEEDQYIRERIFQLKCQESFADEACWFVYTLINIFKIIANRDLSLVY